MNAPRTVLWILGVVFVVFGGIAMVQPTSMTGPPGIDASALGAMTEVRAVYGGLQLGFGAFLIWAARNGSRWTHALIAYGFLIGGVGLCRLVGLLIEGHWSGFHVFALCFEWITAGLALWLGSRRASESLATATTAA